MPRVIVVDSHEKVLQHLAVRLSEEQGLELCGCASLSNLFRITDECHPDVLLIDPYYNQSYNLQLVGDYLRVYPEVRVVALTAVVDTETRVALNRLGVESILEKGDNFEEVVRLIRTTPESI